MSEVADALLREIEESLPQSPERVTILRGLLEKFVELARVDSDTGDLRVAVTALSELLVASTMFKQWRDFPKLAVFGSARTTPDNPLFDMARQLSAEMARRGWMIISGAGPGIMEASAMGAGREHTLGVNIDLPFEQFANPYIDPETMLVAMHYFFTRKVAMTRPSNAFAIFPGGLGTMDEAFEVLTLLHTGKTNPAPVVLIDTPDGNFWSQWMDFVERAMVAGDYIGARDMCLVRVCTTIEEAVAEIQHFHSNYVNFEIRDSRASITIRTPPTGAQLAELASVVPQFAANGGYVLDDSRTISFNFDGRNYVNLRLLIDQINGWAN
jgi:uncharacterized protein (TIGR00730 family)